MLVTEEEAKTKRCQEGYAASPGAARNPSTDHVQQTFVAPSMSAPGAGAYGATVTTPTPATAPIFCLGSECMAWRWGEPPRYEFSKELADGHTPEGDGWEIAQTSRLVERNGITDMHRWRRPKPGRQGYCGKAGIIYHHQT